jgi:hypothetical protein
LVRSVRQDLRSRLFVGTYLLALGGAALVAVSLCLVPARGTDGVGMILFAVATTAWALGAWCVAGQSAFASLLRERQDDTWDLVELTGMGPGRIVRGAWLAGMVQGAVFGAALAPFLTMGFLLRGVDVGMAFIALVGVPLIAAVAVAVGILVATLPQNRATRNGATGLVGLALLGCLGMGLGLIFAVGSELLRELGRDPGAWILVAMILAGGGWSVVLPLVLAASQVSHRAADRSTWPRLCWFAVTATLLVFLVATLALADLIGMRLSARDGAEAVMACGLLVIGWAVLLGIGAVAEPWALSRRQEQSITGAPRWRRWLTPVSGPGAARGRLAFLLLLAVGLGLVLIAPLTAGGNDGWAGAPLRIGLLLAAYACIFLVLGDLLTRRVLPGGWRTPAVQRVVTVAVALILTAITTVPLAVLDAVRSGGIAYVSPLLGLLNAGDAYPFRDGASAWEHPGLWGVLLAGTAAGLHLLVGGLRQGIERAEVLARADDRDPRA